MTVKLVQLQTDLADKEHIHAEKVKALTEEHKIKSNELALKIEQMKETFEIEKTRIEQVSKDQMTQLKQDLDASLAEKGQL